jgi:hypothetical protein
MSQCAGGDGGRLNTLSRSIRSNTVSPEGNISWPRVAIVIHNYCRRFVLPRAGSQYDELERRLASAPATTVPTITLEGDAKGAPHPEPGLRRDILAQISAPADHGRNRTQLDHSDGWGARPPL